MNMVHFGVALSFLVAYIERFGDDLASGFFQPVRSMIKKLYICYNGWCFCALWRDHKHIDKAVPLETPKISQSLDCKKPWSAA